MQNQDPSNPTDDTQMASQLAQFSALEQMTNVANSMNALSSTMTLGQSFTLIGHEIAYTAKDGSIATGVVDGVSVSGRRRDARRRRRERRSDRGDRGRRPRQHRSLSLPDDHHGVTRRKEK